MRETPHPRSHSKPFDGAALFAALDAERCRREMSWREVASEIGISPGTIARTKEGGRMETDGVLAMTRWLGRPLENFSPTNGHVAQPKGETHEEAAGTGRLNTRALHEALDERRRLRGLTWQALAKEIGASETQLTRLSQGGRIEVHLLLSILGSLGRSADGFTRATDG